ncbi:MAG: B-box zinc finger protein [Chloroflexi bacterium]|nr:B-box zinc finger protein [Chloroflexota bacterium]MBI3760562.1 B-box zinc finger protein [Chloroflexota bacterium]
MEATAEVIYCANHPDRETTLRCNKCGKPICSKCALLTEVGYRCRECVRGQQAIFQTAEWYDYVIGGAIALVLSGIITPLGGALGWFAIFLGPIGGTVVAEVVRFAVRKRRGRYFAELVGGAMILGAVPVLLLPLLLLLLFGGAAGLGRLVGLIWPVVFLAMAVGTAYARLRGLTFR